MGVVAPSLQDEARGPPGRRASVIAADHTACRSRWPERAYAASMAASMAPSSSPSMPRTGIRRAGNTLGLPAPLWDSVFLRACRGEATPRTPIWLMRQAGRYMEHYRGIRAGGSFLDLCKDPARCAEVALHARSWLGVDAAIVFSDILVVLEALGLPLEYT
ncbi:MAG: hypothetical protein H0W83_16475, partial [Planctomycetes bacterium]|nr:hypothetical protein [Planctomycetota bacterium]